ncbi:MAG TPA: hypothetical protein VF316_12115 [Polyangiaceae bacterium]
MLLLSCLLTTSGGMALGQSGSTDFDIPFDSNTGFVLTKTNVSADVNQASNASLTSVTFEVVSPPGATLAFLDRVEGYVLIGETRTTLVSLSDPEGTSASLTVEFHGDLRQFFADGHELTVQWLVDQKSYPWPEGGGITVKFRIAVTYTR